MTEMAARAGEIINSLIVQNIYRREEFFDFSNFLCFPPPVDIYLPSLFKVLGLHAIAVTSRSNGALRLFTLAFS